jgi:asparagine synthase (glutamine-hydrolysing)
MCGIAGAISADGVDLGALPAMIDAIRHRGPDGEGYLTYGPDGAMLVAEAPRAANGRASVGFGHLRLSILDLSHAGDQPMVHPSGDFGLITNGEIYNYVELREELAALGHSFNSSGDTEVLLNAYAEWGPDCVQRLVGMWAFAILDLRRRHVFISVDRFGIKPLLYTVAGGTLYFASEPKGLLAAPAVRPEPNEEVVRRYLLTGGVDESARTFFEGIERLRGGHNLTIPLDRPPADLRPQRYWSIPPEGYEGSRKDAAREFRELIEDSVSVHARSDVAVGTCLSGGLDSSTIVCLADELRRRGEVPHYAHSGFGYLPQDSTVSERPYMEEVARKTGLDMTYVEVPDQTFKAALPLVARRQDEPFGSASIGAQWFVFEAAKNAGLKVMLDGQGADEVLGGYHSYLTSIALMMLRQRRPLRYLRFSRQYRRLLGSSPMPIRHAVATMAPMRVRQAASNLAGTLPAASVLSPELIARCQPADYHFPQFDSLNELLASQITTYGLPALLRYEDRNSMAHSIEARVPFLDHRLVEFAFRLPGEHKIPAPAQTKYLIREAMRDLLPKAILDRKDKIGFRAEPSATWELARENEAAVLESRTPYESDWFNRDGLRRLLDGADSSAEREFTLWRALNTKIWLRTFWGDGADPLA